ncbi:MAG: hypothetical protein IPL65_11880 [Lewinellaceae bacterium]|nr:hypothetical protein [Lewinellaceae bacterium]
MKRLLDQPNALERLLQPETPLEAQLLAQPIFREGMFWGEPRFGHPEGKVCLHVNEVLDNINRIPNLDPDDRRRLRLIAYVHDTFKFAEDRSRPRDWSKHHGVLARKFMEQFSDDAVLLTILETHDDAYYVWNSERRGFLLDFDNEQKTLPDLMTRIAGFEQLYYLFFKCDTQTGDKTQASLVWFEKRVPGITYVPIREED